MSKSSYVCALDSTKTPLIKVVSFSIVYLSKSHDFATEEDLLVMPNSKIMLSSKFIRLKHHTSPVLWSMTLALPRTMRLSASGEIIKKWQKSRIQIVTD